MELVDVAKRRISPVSFLDAVARPAFAAGLAARHGGQPGSARGVG